MSTIKLTGTSSGSSIIKAPDSGSTNQTFTLPASSGTLATTADNGSQLDHSGSKKIEAVSTGAAVTGNLTTTGNISTGNNGIVSILDSAGQTSGRIVTDSSAANALEIGADPNDQASGSYTAFRVDNTERMRITPDGLTFNGDTAAANALDDYEEGTWTPSITVGSGLSMGTVHQNRYTKIGRTVTLNASFNINSTSSPSSAGDVRIGGFPFAVSSFDNGGFPIDIHYNYKVTPCAFINPAGYLYYQNTTVGGNNQQGIGDALDAVSVISLVYSYVTT